MSHHDDVIRLQHMRDYAVEAVALSQGRSRDHLDSDRLYNLAMTRLVEVIGESASRLSLATHERYPQIPWSEVIAVRNRLIHGYDQIDLDILWDILELDWPPLFAELRKILGEAG